MSACPHSPGCRNFPEPPCSCSAVARFEPMGAEVQGRRSLPSVWIVGVDILVSRGYCSPLWLVDPQLFVPVCVALAALAALAVYNYSV